MQQPAAANEGHHASGRIAFLDVLRIFAFVSVLICHKFYAEIDAAAQAQH